MISCLSLLDKNILSHSWDHSTAWKLPLGISPVSQNAGRRWQLLLAYFLHGFITLSEINVFPFLNCCSRPLDGFRSLHYTWLKNNILIRQQSQPWRVAHLQIRKLYIPCGLVCMWACCPCIDSFLSLGPTLSSTGAIKGWESMTQTLSFYSVLCKHCQTWWRTKAEAKGTGIASLVAVNSLNCSFQTLPETWTD